MINQKQNLLPNEQELINFDKEIQNYEKNVKSELKKESMNCINILPEYYTTLNNNFKLREEIKTNYSNSIREIISLLKAKKMKITLNNISKEYRNLHNKSISIMTVSRIMRHHMNIF